MEANKELLRAEEIKARELIDKYSICLKDFKYNDLQTAKELSYVLVEEVLRVLDSEGYDYEDYKIIFWNGVKAEIERL